MQEQPTDTFDIDDDEEDNIEEMFLTFAVQDSEYAICLTHVIEIVVGQRVLPVPDVPHFITGVINLRGKVIPVMDMRRRFGLLPQTYHERLGIVVVEVGATTTGLAVDDVRDVRQIPSASIAAAVQHVTANSGFMHGIAKNGDGVTIVLDAARLVSTEPSSVDTSRSSVAQTQQPSSAPTLTGEGGAFSARFQLPIAEGGKS